MASSTVSFATSEKNIEVYLNGYPVHFKDVQPVIENGTTLVPISTILNALGIQYNWIPDTKTISMNTWEDGIAPLKFIRHYVCLDIGSTVVLEYNEIYDAENPSLSKVEDETKKDILSVPAKIIDGRTMIPLRFISETLGYNVDWNQETKTITINDIV